MESVRRDCRTIDRTPSDEETQIASQSRLTGRRATRREVARNKAILGERIASTTAGGLKGLSLWTITGGVPTDCIYNAVKTFKPYFAYSASTFTKENVVRTAMFITTNVMNVVHAMIVYPWIDEMIVGLEKLLREEAISYAGFYMALGQVFISIAFSALFVTVKQYICSRLTQSLNTALKQDADKEYTDKHGYNNIKFVSKNDVPPSQILGADITNATESAVSLVDSRSSTIAHFVSGLLVLWKVESRIMLRGWAIPHIPLLTLVYALAYNKIVSFLSKSIDSTMSTIKGIGDRRVKTFATVDQFSEDIVLLKGGKRIYAELTKQREEESFARGQLNRTQIYLNTCTNINSLSSFLSGMALAAPAIIDKKLEVERIWQIGSKFAAVTRFFVWNSNNTTQIRHLQILMARIVQHNEDMKKAHDLHVRRKITITPKTRAYSIQGTIYRTTDMSEEDVLLKQTTPFAFKKNKKTVVIGKTGAGKSTSAAKVLAGAWGFVDGVTIKADKNRIFIPQKPVIFQGKSLLYSFLFPHVDKSDPAKRLIKSLMRKMDLGQFIKELDNDKTNWFDALSGGQRIRLGIIRGLVHASLTKANVVIMDEPFAGLDKGTIKKLLPILDRHLKNKTVVCISHNPVVMDEFADKVVELKDQRFQASSAANSNSR